MQSMWQVRERTEASARFWWGKPKDEDYLKDLGLDGRMLLKCVLKK